MAVNPSHNKPDLEEWCDVQAWKKEARELQSYMYLLLGDREWDEWDRSDLTILYRKVGFAMFSLPGNLPEKDNNFTGYTQTQLNKIKCIAQLILDKAESDSVIHFTCIFVFGTIKEKRFNIPIFKVTGTGNKTLFIDLDCRVYDKWSDYLGSNLLPKCMYCYPCDGLYQGNEGRVLVDFGTSSGYHTTLICPDCTFHDQNILKEMVAWVEIVSSAIKTNEDLIIASAKLAFPCDDVATDALRITFNIIDVGRLTVNGLGTLNSFISVVDKERKGTLTRLEVFHFSTSILFFSNSLFVENSADKIIKHTQKEMLNRQCDNLTLQRDELFTLLKQIQGKKQIHENINKVQVINLIGDKQAFYKSLVVSRDNLADTDIPFFKTSELLSYHDELYIAPNKIVEISNADFCMILEATKKVKAGDMNDAVYRNAIENTLKENRIIMQYQRREAIAKLKIVFNTNNLEMVKIGNEMIFKHMTPWELDRLANVIERTKYNPKIVEIANEFAKMRDCKTPLDYCNYVELIVKYLQGLKDKKIKKFQADLEARNAKNLEKVDQSKFALECNITEKLRVHFEKEVAEDFRSNRLENFNALEKLYIDLERIVLPLNANLYPNFASDASAVCHCFKHSDFGKGVKLTPEEYFEIASQLINEPSNRISKEPLNQQGDKKIITFTNPIRGGAKGIVFETLADGKQSLATVYYDKGVLNR